VTLPPWGTTLGLLSPWVTALGFLPPCPAAAGSWPHLAGQQTVGATPNAVPHSCNRGVWQQIYISRKFLVGPFIFQKSKKKINNKIRIMPLLRELYAKHARNTT
jgi:hypothetical protein